MQASRWTVSLGFLASCAAAVVVLIGCTPKMMRFDVTIPGNAPSSGSAAAQGTTHVCPDTSVTLSWEVKGKGSLSATPGPRYGPPLCYSALRVPSKGSRRAVPCANETIFRVTASHSFWRAGGSCPGHGCDHADRQVSTAAEVTEPVGGRTDVCLEGACELTVTKPSADWDERYTVGSVSIAGSLVVPVLEQTPGRTLTVSHGGKAAALSATQLTSDALQGEKFSGEWSLQLSECKSGCAALPPVLGVRVEAKCRR